MAKQGIPVGAAEAELRNLEADPPGEELGVEIELRYWASLVLTWVHHQRSDEAVIVNALTSPHYSTVDGTVATLVDIAENTVLSEAIVSALVNVDEQMTKDQVDRVLMNTGGHADGLTLLKSLMDADPTERLGAIIGELEGRT